ncbi:MAG: hypothetical protein IJM21_11520 [Clostridia bacterium]|nr:hypothetical protein [Clostridia bacterium]
MYVSVNESIAGTAASAFIGGISPTSIMNARRAESTEINRLLMKRAVFIVSSCFSLVSVF